MMMSSPLVLSEEQRSRARSTRTAGIAQVSEAVAEFREELARRAKALQSWEEALDARYAEVEALGKATREREAAAAEQQQASERVSESCTRS